MHELISKIAQELSIETIRVKSVVELLFDEGCTIPFIARYRKELTGSMDEVQIKNVRDRYEYLTELEATKARYLKIVALHFMGKPELAAKHEALKAQFKACENKNELDDLYLPYKPKRRSRAVQARELGLEPLLEMILEARATLEDLNQMSVDFLAQLKANTSTDALSEAQEGLSPAESDEAKKRAEDLAGLTAEKCLMGARDILAERIAEDPTLRAKVRTLFAETGEVVSKVREVAAEAAPAAASVPSNRHKKQTDFSKFENYFDFREPVRTIASHRVMAIRRGEAEKVLRFTIEVDKEQVMGVIQETVIKGMPTSPAVTAWMEKACVDTFKRLLSPSLEAEVRLELKNTAEKEAIKVFSTNLEKLLLLPPLPGKAVLGIDPGLRTGSKLAAVDATGKLLGFETIYPRFEKSGESASVTQAVEVIARFVQEYQIGVIAIGNGTGSREIGQVVSQAIRTHGLKVKRVVVNESGASVYSTDEIAREEFPDLDPTIRSAISIARRLQDPLAELVKVDPKSIGVGQYQHDCSQAQLTRSLKETVESCVNKVGVNLNTASFKLLSYVSGIGPVLAKSIVEKRDASGTFASRAELMQVHGFGDKVFQQAAGFLRIVEAENPLDKSAVHPERYALVEQIAADLGLPMMELVNNHAVVSSIALEKYVTDEVGLPTLLDIQTELLKPGRDPRDEGSRLLFSDDVSCIEDLKKGMLLKGTVTNVTKFGAFVDIGVHQDGLVHISQLADSFVSDPTKVVSVGDILQVSVLDADVDKKRISLSCRQQPAPASGAGNQGQGRRHPAPRSSERGSERGGNRPRAGQGFVQAKRAQNQRGRDRGAPSNKKHTMEDLLSKFNNRS
ncbi:MAG: Tex family protein [Zetaproteobacteria bacterium]|nr:Tex family protein [Zetaproteobacteria bacterium]